MNHLEELAKAIDAAIRSNRIKGLEFGEEAFAMLDLVKRGELSLDDYEQAVTISTRALRRGERISLEESLRLSKE